MRTCNIIFLDKSKINLILPNIWDLLTISKQTDFRKKVVCPRPIYWFSFHRFCWRNENKLPSSIKAWPRPAAVDIITLWTHSYNCLHILQQGYSSWLWMLQFNWVWMKGINLTFGKWIVIYIHNVFIYNILMISKLSGLVTIICLLLKIVWEILKVWICLVQHCWYFDCIFCPIISQFTRFQSL